VTLTLPPYPVATSGVGTVGLSLPADPFAVAENRMPTP
jgi:hypothetical protein